MGRVAARDRRRRSWWFSTGVLAAGLLVTACAGGSDGSGVATLDGGSRDGEGSQSQGDGQKDPSDAALAYAKCMRREGIDMPDPKVGEGGLIQIGPGPAKGGLEEPDEDFKAADEKCRHLLQTGAAELSEEDKAALQDAMLQFTECMRNEGIDMPDPTEGGGAYVEIGGEGGIDPDDPEFRRAEEKCRPILDRAIRQTQGGLPKEVTP